MGGHKMGEKITTYSKVLSYPITVSFTCEHCGEQNVYTQEIVGAGQKSKYNVKRGSTAIDNLSPKELVKMQIKAQRDLDRGIENARRKVAKDKFSWIYANKCSKCRHYQSWQTGQIWKNFFKTFFGGPFMLMLIVMFPLFWIFGRDTSKYPEWISIVLSGLMLIIMISAIVILIKSLLSRDRKKHSKPSVII